MIFTLGVSLVLIGFGYLAGLAWWCEGNRHKPRLARSLMFWLIAPGLSAIMLGIAFVLLSLGTLAVRYMP